MTDSCPAVYGWHAFSNSDTAPAALVAYRLNANGARELSGTVVFDTTSGWFSAPFAGVAFPSRDERWHVASTDFSRTVHESGALYVRFPQSVSVIGVFVAQAGPGSTQAQTPCKAPAGFGLKAPRRPDPPALLNPLADIETLPSADTPVALAAPTASPGRTDCAEPFSNAVATEVQRPSVSETALSLLNGPATVLVEVSIDEHGVADAQIWGSSGNRWLDDAALRAARGSVYQPGRAFCEAAPGSYIFRADFRP